jgi:uncharacterized repeat protein (TIGR01451 family)
VPTTVNYTISITNQQTSTDKILTIIDYLPPGFTYVSGSTSGLTTTNPSLTYGLVNGVNRWKLVWNPSASIGSGSTLVLRFSGLTSENISGSYYNECYVLMQNPVPNEFSSLNITYSDFNSGYTWNSAAVVVPAYDTSATAGNVTTNANLAVTSLGVAINSFQVR